jgi:pimeloyl-ACP methyl ester carboxylesterase
VVAGSGWSPRLVFAPVDLAAIGQPTLMVCGSADPVGSIELWQRAMGMLPAGRLEVVDGAGHMPWFDEPARVASLVSAFLARPALESMPLRSAYGD